MKMSENELMGQRIKSARKEAGFSSAEDLAEAVTKLSGRKISQQAIDKLEKGQSASSWAIIYIGELCTRSPYYLATGKDSRCDPPGYNDLSMKDRTKIDELARSLISLPRKATE